MELITYADSELMMIEVASRLAGELRQALQSSETASLAVPGGTTPGPIFDSLCGADLDWDRVAVLLTDERWVPEDSPRSNTRLLRQRLLTGKAAVARYLPLYAPADTPEEGIPQLAEAISGVLPLTACLLGMGADMHTASIFPGADRLSEALAGDAILVPMRAPGAPEPRVTLSAPVLAGAISRHIVITGPEKREALERARTLPPEEAPVAAVLKGATIHWAES
ncbi:6-phosphogluconolactonase, eukaryotic type [Rubellimicrobium mesophilum DSM 19309]|uniref:6-phosphogluconolactonase n=1 Tax=Rubellimicrobium mesophilum DSM 19309 TaxID=442562 RepID=A0A017HQX6_9RHOB|nr:6-phosphogluconolactonase [Rubellimicrobium mesophilum]EYD76730.1 6-phosphogluconolactonase, eukaryotic type [Rubellimicrobium mesophilum DSM 19309]